jgi:large subunit ribosomal protein L13
MRTYTPKASEIQRDWHVVDAEGMVLGRLCTEVARVLRGKHKPIFAPHIDTGDHVVIVNASKVVMSSGKADRHMLYRHTGYPGGIKSTTPKRILEGRFPERVLELAVERMLARGPLQRKLMRNLKIYKGGEHPHAAQSPVTLDVAKLNRKNSRA